MNVLGIDTATAATAAGVLRSDGSAFESVSEVDALTAPPAHGRELLPAVADAMDSAGLGFDDLETVAVGIGPGAYTGLRIGVSTARALAQAAGLRVTPIGSLAALAAGSKAPVAVPVLDARRGEVFAALFVEGWEVVEPFVAPSEEVASRLASSLGDVARDPLAIGDGSLRFRHVLEAAGIAVAPPESPRHVVRAVEVCRLAVAAPAVPAETVVPRYLRDPDAAPRR